MLLRLADLLEDGRPPSSSTSRSRRPASRVAVVADGELPFAADNLRFFAGCGPLARGQRRRRAQHRLHLDAAAPARRRRGRHRAVELPAHHGDLEDRAGAGRRKHGGAEARAARRPRSTLRLAELAVAAGLPPGVLNVVTGGADVGEALVRDPQVRMVSVTGSARTGQAVMRGRSRPPKRVHLELGGKAPAAGVRRRRRRRSARARSPSAPRTTPGRTARPPRASTSSARGSTT